VGQHVARDVAAIHVNPGLQQGNERASRAAGQIQHGLAKSCDLANEKRDLEGLATAVVDMLGPTFGHQAVMPNNGVRHRPHV
jgi:hypothetical protein